MSKARSPDAPNVRIIPPLVYLAGLVIGFLIHIWMPLDVLPQRIGWLIGAVLITCGVLLAASAVLTFRGAWTTIRPDRAASALVVTGPYKISRNPMYLGLAFIYSGIAIAGQSIWALILLPIILAIIQFRAIAPEEAFLKRRFGVHYVSYMATVRRWL